MWICITLIALGAIALVFYLLEKTKRYSLKGVLLKTIVSLLFIAVAVLSSHFNGGHKLNAFIIIGLVLGLLGDIWLDLKFVYPNDDKLYTYAGFIVFGIGHILFVSGMFVEFFNNANPLYIILPLVGALLFTFANLLLSKPMKLDYKDMKLTVIIYAFLLACTPLSALSLCIRTAWISPTLIMLFIGGVLFAISDVVLSGQYFGENKERTIDFILNYLTYYGAQFVIAFSLFFI